MNTMNFENHKDKEHDVKLAKKFVSVVHICKSAFSYCLSSSNVFL